MFLHTIHVGPRTTVEQTPLPTAIGAICGNCHYETATVAASTFVEATVIQTLPTGGQITVIVQPANTSGFYLNYPQKPFVSVSYENKY